MTNHVVIAHGGDVSQPSGGTNRVTAFAAGLADTGYGVSLVVPTPSEDLPRRLSSVDVVPVSVPNSGIVDQPIRAVSIVRTAKRVASRTGGTIQFEHSTLGGVGQLLGASEYVLDMHDLAFESPLYGNLPLGSVVQRAIRRIEGRAVRAADEVVVVSEKMRSLVADAWDLDRDSIAVVQNGYFTGEIEDHRTTDPTEGRVAFLGTLHPKLDVGAIFDVARLSEVEELVVIGDGARREDLEEGKAAHGLDSLRIAGRLPNDEAYDILGSSAVAINPQQPSGLQRASSPVKIFYYAALGLPMVVSEGPSVAENLADDDAAVVVPFDESFAEAVGGILRDDERRTAIRENVTAAAPAMSWDHRVDQLAEVYER